MTPAPPMLANPKSGGRRADAAGLDEVLNRIDRGFASADDFLLMGEHPTGRAALEQRSTKVWPQLRCLAAIHPELIPPFLHWFREQGRLNPYTDAAFEALSDDDVPTFDKYWKVISRASEKSALATHFREVLRDRRGELRTMKRGGRTRLRHEAVSLFAEANPDVVPLLFPLDPGECDEILGDPKLPPSWRGFTMAATLKRSKLRGTPTEVQAAAREHLAKAEGELLLEFLMRAQHIYPEHPEIWETALHVGVDRLRMLDQLLEIGPVIPVNRWAPLVQSLGLLARPPEVAADWPRWNRLLSLVGVDPAVWPIWRAVLRRLDLRFLRGDFSQVAEWTALESYRRKLADDKPFPPVLTARLEAGMTLLNWIGKASATPPPPASLHAALGLLGADAPYALRQLYEHAFGCPTPAGDRGKFERFAALFEGLYPARNSSPTAVAAWQHIAAAAPAAERERVLAYYWNHLIEETPLLKTEAMPAFAPNALKPAPRGAMFEALLYCGIIAGVVVLLGTVLLIW